MVLLLGVVELEERRFEFQSPLVDGYRVADMSRWRNRHIRRGLPEQRNFELAYAIHTVKQAQEMNLNVGTAECLIEFLHICLLILFIFGLGARCLVVAESRPGEMHHFFIAL